MRLWLAKYVDFFSAPPKFVTRPSSIEVTVHDQVASFKCLATGDPVPKIKWRKDGENLPQDNHHVILQNGSLEIINPSQSDEGIYQCVAQSEAGEVTSEAALKYYEVVGK